MTPWKTTLALTTVLLTAGTVPAQAEQQDGAVVASDQAKAQATATVTGKMVLPPETPAWFKGGALTFDHAVARLEGRPNMPKMPRPDNYREMTREQRQAWFEGFKKTQEFKDYQAKAKAAYENRPMIEAPMNADGSFTLPEVTPGRYTLVTFIPHKDADPKHMSRQSWATGGKRIEVKEGEQTVEAGPIPVKLTNVLMPGEEAPAWTATDYEGNEVKLSDFRGKYVLLDFWATWCGPCIAEMPNLKETYKLYGGERFEIVALSLDNTIDLPISFKAKNPAPYTQLYLGKWNADETTTKQYGVSGIPSIWLIGPDGKIVARDLRGEALQEAVKKSVEGAVSTS